MAPVEWTGHETRRRRGLRWPSGPRVPFPRDRNTPPLDAATISTGNRFINIAEQQRLLGRAGAPARHGGHRLHRPRPRAEMLYATPPRARRGADRVRHAEAHDFAEQSFDALLSICAIEHFNNSGEALDDMTPFPRARRRALFMSADVLGPFARLGPKLAQGAAARRSPRPAPPGAFAWQDFSATATSSSPSARTSPPTPHRAASCCRCRPGQGRVGFERRRAASAGLSSTQRQGRPANDREHPRP